MKKLLKRIWDLLVGMNETVGKVYILHHDRHKELVRKLYELKRENEEIENSLRLKNEDTTEIFELISKMNVRWHEIEKQLTDLNKRLQKEL